MNTLTAQQHNDYAIWLGELAGLVGTHILCDIDDLPDAPFMDMFEDGETPTQAFNICCEQWWDVPILHLDEDEDEPGDNDW